MELLDIGGAVLVPEAAGREPRGGQWGLLIKGHKVLDRREE